jgi:hypothetical protein
MGLRLNPLRQSLKRRFWLFSLVFLLLTSLPAWAQFERPQNPPGLKWKFITTCHFEIIFPQEIEKDAQRVANTLEHIYAQVSKSLKIEPERISLILQNQTSESNGFVDPAPRRMEFFNVPPQESFAGAADWYNLLAVHEFRHVAQIDKMNRGFIKILQHIFGAISQYFSFFATPLWFWEGDAVYAETALTEAGRGREPSFDVELRALLLSGKRYPYYKAMFGSYRDWDPLASPYLLGYFLTSHIRRGFGAQTWCDVLDQTAAFPFMPHWFSRAMRDKVRKGPIANYEETMNDLGSLWRKQLEGLRITDARCLHQVPPGAWTYNLGPQYSASGKIVLERYGLEDLPHFILLDPSSGEEEKLFDLGQLNSRFFSVAGNKIIWTEQEYDPRWGYRDYSVMKLYDLQSKTLNPLASQTRLFSPSLSPDGTKIVAVEFSTSNDCSLVILDAETGRKLRIFQNPENEFLQTPRWSPDGRWIVLAKYHPARGKAISLVSMYTGTEEVIAPYSKLNLQCPVTDGEWVYFVSPYSGIDNIYAANIETKQVYQVTSRKFGAYFPSLSLDLQELLFNDVTKDGYQAMEMALRPEDWTPLESVEVRRLSYAEPLIAEEAGGDIFKNIPRQKYEVRDYRPSKNLFNFHSRFPVYTPDNQNATLTFLSQNLLGTMQISPGYEFNLNEKTHRLFLKGNYAGWYPVLDFGVDVGGRASNYLNDEDNQVFYSWKETSLWAGLRLPLNLTKGQYWTELSLGADVRYSKVSDLTHWEEFKNNYGTFVPLTYRLHFSRSYRWIKDIYPVWGQVVDLAVSHTPFHREYQGSLFSVQGKFFFPGLKPHHSAFLDFGYERQIPENYRFESEMLFARGYDSEYHDNLLKIGLNYALPLLYPDWNLLHTLHFKRVHANVFFDYLRGSSELNKELYRSIGVELYTDFHIFSFSPAAFRLGLRISYLIDKKDMNFGLAFGL